MKTALIAGASGLVGRELLQILLQEEGYERVYALVRRPLGLQHSKLTEVLCDFNQLEDVQDYFQVHDVFCCLGTTIKKAKTKEVMYKVDVEYPVAIAKLAEEKGAHHFLLISSMNANPQSKIWYPKMKGALEEEIKEIPFHVISIFRPSLLLGKREEFRLGENAAAKIFKGMSLFLKDSWKSKMAIEAESVAKALFRVAQMDNKGVAVYSASSIEEISRARQHN